MIEINDSTGIFKGKSSLMGDENALAIDAIAHAIAFQQLQVIALLKKYGIAVSAAPTQKELLNSLMQGFSKNKNMQSEFTGMLLGKMSRFSNFGPGDCAPPFDADGNPLNCDGSIAGSNSTDTGNGNDPSNGVPATPCSWWAKTFSGCGAPYVAPTAAGGTPASNSSSFGSILSGIGNIVGIFGKPSTAAQANQTAAQIAAAAAAKAAAAKTTTTIWIVVGLLIAAAITIGVAMHMHKNKKIAEAA